MPHITCQAIVLRHADYRDHDRMLTLFSPTLGRVEALCRGCKKIGSPLLACSEWFAFGEYVLYTGKGRMTVVSCNLTESFFPLRSDYDKLKYATYMLSVCEATVQPNEPAVHLFTLLARSLSRLCYQEKDPKAVTAAFLLHAAAISGYRPRLSHCVKCARRLEEKEIRHFDTEEGGLVCPECSEMMDRLMSLTPAENAWMKDVLLIGIDKTELPETDAPAALLSAFVEERLEKPIRHKGLF
ncbi:MAG: DNA repair protein RecO [Clostridia bacterium]|nr:DNA repair protein RecO [Clostridia bacterium]MBR6808681.1 DNA repair protein RecO [Clostridia bacterium]